MSVAVGEHVQSIFNGPNRRRLAAGAVLLAVGVGLLADCGGDPDQKFEEKTWKKTYPGREYGDFPDNGLAPGNVIVGPDGQFTFQSPEVADQLARNDETIGDGDLLHQDLYGRSAPESHVVVREMTPVTFDLAKLGLVS